MHYPLRQEITCRKVKQFETLRFSSYLLYGLNGFQHLFQIMGFNVPIPSLLFSNVLVRFFDILGKPLVPYCVILL